MTRLQWTIVLLVALLSIVQMLPFLHEPFWTVTARAPKPYSEDRLLLRRAATRGLAEMLTDPWVIRRYWRPVTSAWAWLVYRVAGMDPAWYRLLMSAARALAAVLVALLAVRLSGVGWAGPLAAAAFAFVWWSFWPRQWIAAAGDVLAAPLLAGAALSSMGQRWGWFSLFSAAALGARELSVLCVWSVLPRRVRWAALAAVLLSGAVWAGLYWHYCTRLLKASRYVPQQVSPSQVAVLAVTLLCLLAIRRETWRKHGHMLMPTVALAVMACCSGDRYLYLAGVLLFPVLAGQLSTDARRNRPVVAACLAVVVVSWAIYPQLAREVMTATPGAWLGWTAR
jgi:ABC-type multidrug transport system fused ATPase/permease subunit